jgi:hypothetical protein
VGTPGRPDAASIKEKKVNMRTLMAIASVLAEFAFDALPLSPADAQDDPSNLAEVLEGLIRDATQDDPTSSAAPDQYSGDGTTVEPSPTNVEGTCENVGDHTNSYSEYIYPDVGHISEKVEHAQCLLKENWDRNLEVDGVYGPDTEAEIREIQRDTFGEDEDDGIIGRAPGLSSTK